MIAVALLAGALAGAATAGLPRTDGGMPLSPAVRREVEPALGASLEGVRVHIGNDVSVAVTAILFGELAVLLAIPLAAVVGTLFEVVVLERDPAEQEVPAVLFPAQDAETR